MRLAQFEQAVGIVREKASEWHQAVQLEFYGLYKCALEGAPPSGRPFLPTARAKWDAWKKAFEQLKETSHFQDEAKERYVALLIAQGISIDTAHTTQMGFKVSQMAVEEELNDSVVDPFVSWMSTASSEQELDLKWLDSCDENQRTALHWACDRGHLNWIELLVKERPSLVNALDLSCQTPLHYGNETIVQLIHFVAAVQGNEKIVELLVQSGADKWLKDADGMTALDYAELTTNAHLYSLLS